MKALQLLEVRYKDCKEWEDKGFTVTYPTKDLSEVIKELENMQNRSCKTCKYYKPNNTTTCNGFIQGEECLRFVDSIHTIPCETFCCNKWEQ